MCSEERGERGEGSNASARLCMFRHPILDVFGEWWCFSFALYLCGCCKFSMTHPCRCRAAGGHVKCSSQPCSCCPFIKKKKKKNSSPIQSTSVHAKWGDKQVCGMTRKTGNVNEMEWSQLQPRRAPSSDRGGEGEGTVGKTGERRKLQAGMKVRKPSLSKEPKRRIKNKTKWGKSKIFAWFVASWHSHNNKYRISENAFPLPKKTIKKCLT